MNSLQKQADANIMRSMPDAVTPASSASSVSNSSIIEESSEVAHLKNEVAFLRRQVSVMTLIIGGDKATAAIILENHHKNG